MKIRLRLTLLLGCLLVIFGSFAWLIRVSHENESKVMLADLRAERARLLDQLLTLTGQSLDTFASDYSRWDEMVTFLRTNDPAWAEENLARSLPNFDAQAAWVLHPDGRLAYTTQEMPAGQTLVLPPELVAWLARNPSEDIHTFHWFSPAGLLEMRSAPIVPSSFPKQPSPPLGWWVVARRWDHAHLATIATPLQGRLYTLRTAPPPTGELNIRISRALTDWSGRPAGTLYLDYRPAELAELLASNDNESYLFYGFSLTLILLTVAGLSRWVIAPLGRLERSLATGRSEPLAPLLDRQHEFGHLARLVEQSFTQRDALRREITEREKAETSLSQSKELHNRLARDLHDGAIQSIYAAGLGLENMRALLATDPVAAEQRLDACLRSFNQTIASIRSFIYGLESAANQPHSFQESMTALVATMRSLQPVPITLAIDNRLRTPLTDAQEIHLLQITRESLSNALRHSGARAIAIAFTADDTGTGRLIITDDGSGFDPAIRTGRGHGLANLAARARELPGELQIDSAPGKGTRIIITFTHLAPP